MRQRFLLFLICGLLFGAVRSSANHIYGADFFYEHISGMQYRITLVLYGNCEAGSVFSALKGASPTVHVYEGTTLYNTVVLSQQGQGEEVTPVCERELNNTKCKSPSNTIPGVTRFTYATVVTFPHRSANWRFNFDGVISTGTNATIAGRAAPIGNIIGAASSVTGLNARLNNLNANNSSPQFTTIPTPFYCVNVPQQYNQGAVDKDNDSLDYALVPGIVGTAGNGGTPGTAQYFSPYSGAAPMNGDVTGWSFNTTNGQLDFTPNVVKQYLVVNEVKEYRNGVVVGTSMREMTFIILANCNTRPSKNGLDTARAYQVGVHMSRDVVTICQATDTARFAIVPTDASGDTILASVNGLPQGMSATFYNNNSPRPIILINWYKANLSPGTYTFYVTYRDKGCPLTSQQTQAYTLRVVAANQLAGPDIIAPTNCVRKALVQITPFAGLTPRTVTISRNGTVIGSYRDLNGAPIRDSLEAGTYTVEIRSDGIECPTQRTITVADSGAYPYLPSPTDQFYCLNDAPLQLHAGNDTGAVLHWFMADGSPLAQAPVPQTTIAGRTFYLVRQDFKVCKSALDTAWVYVTKRPVAIISGDNQLCSYDTGTFRFTGSVGEGPILEYRWTWDKAFYTSGTDAGPWKTIWGLAGKKQVTLQVLENKCPSNIDTFDVLVKPKPFSGFDVQPTICRLDTLTVRYNTSPLDAQVFDWHFSGGMPADASAEGPFRIAWDTPGVKRITLRTELDGCVDTRYKDVTVYPTPAVRILNSPASVCIGDKLYLQASGADRYTWHPIDSMRFDEGGMYAIILKPSRYSVIGTNEWSCQDSAAIAYPVVEACCSFGYPNAFTPNGDGKNDGFAAVTYGNHLEYELSIYNRWGQRIFIGHDPKAIWDGTFGGKPCDAGTYYYMLRALCYTGHREFQKGDVILVR